MAHLSNHLLPAFSSRRLDRITVEDVDRYRLGKVREGKLNPTSINKTLTTLTAILEAAVEYELIDRNPARGRRRRLPAVAPRRPWLDRAEHMAALLAAASALDEKARARRGQRRALLATLVFAGLRIGEALSLRWRDVDLARGTITVRAAKTDAGIRVVNMLPVLSDELGDYRARLDPTSAALVFGTATGHRQGATNVRRRMLAKAVERANQQLAEDKAEPLPDGLTPHSLRRTFASLLFAIGEPPPYVMGADGAHHAEPHADDLRPPDGPPRRRARAPEGAGRGAGLDRVWAANGQQGHYCRVCKRLSLGQKVPICRQLAPVAQWIERSPPEREVASSNLAGRVLSTTRPYAESWAPRGLVMQLVGGFRIALSANFYRWPTGRRKAATRRAELRVSPERPPIRRRHLSSHADEDEMPKRTMLDLKGMPHLLQRPRLVEPGQLCHRTTVLIEPVCPVPGTLHCHEIDEPPLGSTCAPPYRWPTRWQVAKGIRISSSTAGAARGRLRDPAMIVAVTRNSGGIR